ncbi:hypothetical protein NEPAR06_2445 [Nematocida parisii]|uniref:Uncharacterized protein n=1 Tax=Nematocida parisii (strain ERTm3) TaxID=935791 RepID=I3ED22_NEMP3|nr:uncharacterized protein NEPG_02619 [Nematocida parisii ERTm1]EIJ87119.1 hypothetical protein NEQG_02688 [Nematocida parisii ERTm3]KAI5146490.1 hypothetical protein NEPAR07_2413 [Nematocida parisii]EIJ92521.1 hypothetical protein NEPG_02619 [Nematocida parisii ERTm1]KAI5157351.1 hypothetical protein NEPAR06_2445 [Nematocida parisii]KAI5159405.1 hypothetical protein NEPAR05_2473 [Nematocida parisii]|eukprot:XP_013060446.1 hypothetical protein NEPG_02619 [Nematocida parisii ERTm1]
MGINICSDKRKRAARVYIHCRRTSSFIKNEYSTFGLPATIESDPSAEGKIWINCLWKRMRYSFFTASRQILPYTLSLIGSLVYL